MATKAKKIALSGFADKLIAEGLLTAEVANDAVNAALEERYSCVLYLLKNKLLNPQVAAGAASEYFGVPLFDIDALDDDCLSLTLINEKLIEKHQALPLFRRGDNLYIGIADPANVSALYEMKFHTGLNTSGILVEADKLSRKIEEVLAVMSDQALGDLNDSSLDFADISADDDLDDEGISDSDVDDAPIVRFVNKVLLDAIKKGASDIHFEPYDNSFRVRYRIDGILYEVAAPPVNLSSRIVARLKVMSKLDISERRIPQDGHFKLKLSRKNIIDFRVSSCPTVGGEKLVLRILDPASARLGIDKLGYEPFQKTAFMDAIHKPQGMVLVTGPTGSGKTVSLYTALNILNTPERNISTVEDPVEINLAGINQVNINTKAGLDFGVALRSFLRQDPDVIMVGEIRDLETAEIAIKAAQTGHLVLSTLHTNNTPETLGRLINMGVPPFNLATSISLIIAQRLARRLCEQCKKPVKLPDETLLEQGFTPADLKTMNLFSAEGCDRCTNGYSGRIGLYEVLIITEALGHIIMEGGNALQIADVAKQEGLQTLRQSGLKKARQGVTSLEEINRVTKD